MRTAIIEFKVEEDPTISIEGSVVQKYGWRLRLYVKNRLGLEK